MDRDSLAELLQLQAGVVSRHQLLEHAGRHDVRRLLRRRELTVVHPGVYVDHTGPLTWQQRAWAAVLHAGPCAALDRESAIRADAGPGWRGCGAHDPIRVAVDASRTVTETAGVRVRRVAGLHDRVRWTASPPRMRPEEATLDLALAQPDDHAAFEALAGSVRARCTTPARLLAALAARSRVRRRAWLVAVLVDLRDGTCSVLEHGYLTRVERAHGLPGGRRQHHERSPAGRSLYRDVEYAAQRVTVELDGRLHTEAARRDADLDRDLDLVVQQRLGVRLGWGQVFGRSCATAARVARILQARGWTGTPVPCGPTCRVVRPA